MSQPDSVATQNIALTNSDLEPIHIPGSIQPHGILFVLQEPQLKILQVSNNTFELIGHHPQDLLNKPLKDLLGLKQTNTIEQSLLADFESVNPLKISIKKQGKSLIFDGIVHRFNDTLILELEFNDVNKNVDFIGFYNLVRGSITKLQKAATLLQMCEGVAQEIRKISGFDRVMIYQFDSEGAGAVIAEDKSENLSSYLGLHYPSFDVPERVKQLYALISLRLIPDINSQPVNLLPVLNPLTNKPVDLSLSVLRSISPCHIEYLQNMEVRAAMSIPLVHNRKLWGLIACHHQSAKHIPYGVRTACEFLGQIMSLELVSKEKNEDLEYKAKLMSIESALIELIAQAENFTDSLAKSAANLLELVSARGVAICLNGKFTLMGKTPEEADLKDLLEWIGSKTESNIFHTNALSKDYPAAEKFQDCASGLLALTISKARKNFILWFRPEVTQTVNWGGDPDQPVAIDADRGCRLAPRKSFELWQEIVRGSSLPWKPCEIEAVAELRNAIVGIVLRHADELAEINIELQRSNQELDAFAYIASHDLKEPLRGIHNYSSFLLEDYAHTLEDEGISKLETLIRLTQRMEDLIDSLLHFSRIGRVELAKQQIDLNEQVKTVIEMLGISRQETSVDICIPQPLPSILCDRAQVNELFVNLISNAIKYNDKTEKRVEVGFLDAANIPEPCPVEVKENNLQSAIVFYVQDNGIGIREKHLDVIFRIFKRLHGPSQYGGGTGAGLTIAKKIVERHGGIIWVKSIYGEGTTFYFTLPG